GDMAGVLAVLDTEIADTEPGFDLARLLSAKAITLYALTRDDEAIGAAREAVDVLGGDEEHLRLAFAGGRKDIATCLLERGELAAGEQALSDVVSFYEADDDPWARAVAINAEGLRFWALFELGRSDAVPDAWVLLRDSFGSDEQCEIRRAIAEAGRRAAF